MFDSMSYIGFTLLFCVPPLMMLWLRREFVIILRKEIRLILTSTFLITVYGSILWPLAIDKGAWSYGIGKFTGAKLLNYVYVDDVVWWIFVSLLFSSFIVVSAHCEERGKDLFSSEVKALLRSFRNAIRGLFSITLERNSTIHAAVAVFVILEGILFRITWIEWLFVIAAIGLVLCAELLNSSVERLATKLSDKPDMDIRLIKDTAAAGVLIGAIAAGIIGVKIFLSKFFYLISP
ncbi:diacylglycerol kinase family protein [candidate division KSB1 bacterium]